MQAVGARMQAAVVGVTAFSIRQGRLEYRFTVEGPAVVPVPAQLWLPQSERGLKLVCGFLAAQALPMRGDTWGAGWRLDSTEVSELAAGVSKVQSHKFRLLEFKPKRSQEGVVLLRREQGEVLLVGSACSVLSFHLQLSFFPEVVEGMKRMPAGGVWWPVRVPKGYII